MLLLLIFTTVSGAVAVQWTSSSTFPNGSIVQACVGDNITLPWDFNRTSPQRIYIDWFKDQEETILAYYHRGVFAPFSFHSPHIDFLPNAGIILTMATLSDTGYYRVELNVRGDPQIYVQGAFVQVSAAPVTIDGGLHAFILPKSVYQETTGQWHLQLGCGTFKSLGQPLVSVKWNTPSREIINSTSYDKGVFILTVSNPVEDGEYSCFLERISPAVVCLHNQSSMNRAATVDVKGVHTRISLLEGGLEALREETVNLTVPVSDLEDLVHKLKTSDKIFEDRMDILQDTIFNITTENKQLRQEVQRLESVDRNITTENKQLRQEVQRLENVDRNITDLMQENNHNVTTENKQLRQELQILENVNINITDLMLENSRQINDVKGDVRKLQSDKDYLEAILVFNLKDQFGLSRIQRKDFTEKPTSCEDVKNYDNSSGIHTLFLGDSRILNVYCDQSTDNGGWMVIHRRQDGSVNFYRDWNQYEVGFGNLSTEFWLGLANLHQFTKSKTVKLRVDLTDFNGSTAYAVYNMFSIRGVDDKYRLHVSGYNGTAGDSLIYHNRMQFSTFDRDHDGWSSTNCAHDRHGAWWYDTCAHSNLNGRYKSDGAMGDDGVIWVHWKSNRSLKGVEMKIKE